jgi:Tol biopolymer transport system component
MILLLLSEIANFALISLPSPLGFKISGSNHDSYNAYAAVSNATITNGWIAFGAIHGKGITDCDGGIRIMNADNGSHPIKIPGTFGCGSNPSFSPDGKKIAFDKPVWDGRVHFMDGSEIFVVNVDGTDLVSLTNKNYTDGSSRVPYTSGSHSPSFSPDGKEIVFSRWNHLTPSFSIYIMNAADGSGLVRLTKKNKVVDEKPSFSPDGKKIVFVRFEDKGAVIYTMNAADGSGLVRLTHVGSDRISRPSFSPDGKMIVFVSEMERHYYENIYVMNATDGTQVKRLTKINNDYHEYYDPAWSPDGKKIAFAERVDGKSGTYNEIFVMNATDGSNQEQLTHINSEGPLFSPAWSPLGQSLSLPSDSTLTDAVPPSLTITYPTNGTVFNITSTNSSLSSSLSSIIMTGNAYDNVSGVKKVEVCLDYLWCGLANGTTSWRIPIFKSLLSSSLSQSTLDRIAEGAHQIEVMAKDYAENIVSLWWTISLKVQQPGQGGQQVPPPQPVPVPAPQPPITGNKVIATSNGIDDSGMSSSSSSCLTQLSGHGAKIFWNSTSNTCTIGSGILVISKSGSLTIGGGSSITLVIAKSSVLQNDGIISNSGRIRISEGGIIMNTGTINNSGIIVNNKHATIENHGIISNSNTIDNFGVIHNDDDNDNTAVNGNNNGKTSGGMLVNSGYVNSNNLGGRIITDHAGVVINSGYIR